MKKMLLKEALVATVMIFILYLLVSLIAIKSELAKPFKQDLNDFDIYDLHFSGMEDSEGTRDSTIVLVEIGNGRKEIARQVELLQSLEPAVIGVDVVFEERKEDTLADSYLEMTAGRGKNIIWGSIIKEKDPGIFHHTSSFFKPALIGQQEGYINFIGGEYSSVRFFAPFASINDQDYFSFAARVIQVYAPGKLENLKKRNKRSEAINYSGSFKNYSSFTAGDLAYYLRTGQLEYKIRGKIVLLGYFKKHPPYVLEDLHFTPMNKKVSGRSFPDTYGLTIHANIISMILSENYIKVKSKAFAYLLACILTFLFTFYLLWRYSRKKHPSHLWFIILQLVLIILVTYVLLLVFDKYLVKIPLLPVIITIVLSVEALGLYKLLALWLNRKWNYKTVFAKNY